MDGGTAIENDDIKSLLAHIPAKPVTTLAEQPPVSYTDAARTRSSHF